MFDEKKARRVIRFIECLKHTKGEFHGKPFKLLPWQEKIIRDVFGTVRDEDPSMRQYNQVYRTFRSHHTAFDGLSARGKQAGGVNLPL